MDNRIANSVYITFQHSFDTSQSFVDIPLNQFSYKEVAPIIMSEGCKPVLAIKVKSLKGGNNA